MSATLPTDTRRATGGKKKAAKPSSRPASRSKSTRRPTVLARIEDELPKDLRDFSRRVRRDLTEIEKQIEGARADLRRGRTRLLRDVSHQLGRFEAEQERRWKKLALQARRDVVKALRKLEKLIEPPKPKKKKRKATQVKPKTSVVSEEAAGAPLTPSA